MLTEQQNFIVIERYLPGARTMQNGLCLVAFLGCLVVLALAIVQHEPHYLWILCGPGCILFLALAFRLRSVTYSLAPGSRLLLRQARWMGVLVKSQTIDTENYSTIRLGYYSGGRESFPIYWAELPGPTKHTLVESMRKSEVTASAEQLADLLNLPVS